MDKLIRIKDFIVHAMAVVAGLAVVAMMALTCAAVFDRNVMHQTLVGAYETTQYILMPLAIFLAMPAAYDAGIMPRVGDLADKAPKKVRTFIYWSVFIVELIIYFLLTYCAVRFAINGFATHIGVTMGGKIISTFPVYIVLPVGFAGVVILVLMKYLIPKRKKGNDDVKQKDAEE